MEDIENKSVSSILDDIKNLNDSELFESAEILGSFVVSKTGKSKHANRSYTLYADALFGLCEFRRSQKYYKMALKSRKYVVKATTSTPTRLLTRRRANSAPMARNTPAKRKKREVSSSEDVESEAMLRFKIHKCLKRMNDDRGALAALEKIPSSSRDPKILIAMGKLYEKRGVQRQAIRVYRQALSMNPRAVGALLRLQHLGASKNDVSKFLSSHHKDCKWIETFANAKMSSKENHHPSALRLYEELNKEFPSNPHILRNMGISHLKRGDMYKAKMCFEQMHKDHPYVLDGMDMYACSIFSENDNNSLGRLIYRLLEISDKRPESWNSVGMYCSLKGEHEKAEKYLRHAIELNPTRVYSHILLGTLLTRTMDLNGAEMAFLQACSIDKTSLMAMRGLVNVYVTVPETKRGHALRVAKQALKVFPKSAQAHELMGRALLLFKDNSSQSKSRIHLEKALSLDPRCKCLCLCFYRYSQTYTHIHIQVRMPQHPLHSIISKRTHRKMLFLC